MSREEGLILSELICKPHYSNAVEVRIYDNDKNMYEAAQRWNKKHKNKYMFDDSFDALTLENSSNEIRKRDNKEYKIFATIFLNKNHLTYGVVAHEFIHATFSLFRSVLRFDCKFEQIEGTGDDEEEIFCYTVEGYINNLLKSLKKKGIELNNT
jgi:hypothetical protein